MKKIGTTLLGVVVVALATAACSTTERSLTLISSTATVVAGVSLLDPTQAASVTYDAVQLAPDQAAHIAAFAVAAAPDEASRIVRAATNGAPGRAAEIDAAAKRVLRRRSTQTAHVPNHEYLVRLVDLATPAQGQ